MLGLAVEETTLSRLARAAPPAIASELLGLKAQLKVLSEKVARQNAANIRVAQASSGIMNALGRLLSQLVAEPLIYQPHGNGAKIIPMNRSV
jgi:hypothetical protein